MVIGFLISRVILSIGMLGFCLAAFLMPPKPQKWWTNTYAWLGIAWVLLFALTYFWSSNMDFWSIRVQTKLPILLLPLAFACMPAFSVQLQRVFTLYTALLLLAGICYSMSFLVSEPESYLWGYKFSHVLPTPAEGDHIRFSMFIALFIIWCVSFWRHLGSRWLQWGIAVFILIATVYLHILAAKSGLLILYVFAILCCLYLIYKRKTRIVGLSLVASFIVFVFLAVNFIPTLKDRIGYLRWTYMMYEQGKISGEYSDMGRAISYDVAYKVLQQHWLIGVGAGDILDEMKKGYDQWYPQVKDEQRLVPHNQFLTVGVAAGVPVMCLFALWVIYPLFQLKRGKKGFFFVVVWLGVLSSLFIEPMLEVQFGVYVFIFFLLWQRHHMLFPSADTMPVPDAVPE